jgi:hypothetical protein
VRVDFRDGTILTGDECLQKFFRLPFELIQIRMFAQ